MRRSDGRRLDQPSRDGGPDPLDDRSAPRRYWLAGNGDEAGGGDVSGRNPPGGRPSVPAGAQRIDHGALESGVEHTSDQRSGRPQTWPGHLDVDRSTGPHELGQLAERRPIGPIDDAEVSARCIGSWLRPERSGQCGEHAVAERDDAVRERVRQQIAPVRAGEELVACVPRTYHSARPRHWWEVAGQGIRGSWSALVERVRDTTWSRVLRILSYLLLLSLIVAAFALAFANRRVDSRMSGAPLPTSSMDVAVAEEVKVAAGAPWNDVGRFSSGPWSAPSTTASRTAEASPTEDRSTRPPSAAEPTTTSTTSTTTSEDTTTTSTSETRTTSIPSTGSTSTTSIAVRGVDAVGDKAGVEAGKDEKIKVLDNDASVDSKLDPDTLTITASPTKAEEFRVHGDHLHYRSLSDASGTDQLRYRICDEVGRCAEATLTITIE